MILRDAQAEGGEPSSLGRVTIIGVGLIGGSLGMALLRRRTAQAVIGYDRVQSVLPVAQRLGAITQAAGSLREAVAGADVVIVATPVGAVVPAVIEALAAAPAHAWLTDVASVKGPVIAAVQAQGGTGRFVGGHPMAGAELSGVEAADPYLFENAIYLLTPTPDSPAPIVKQAQTLARAVGALPLVVDPVTHDRMVAVISHLPHMVAACLVETARQASRSLPLLMELAAGGFRDTTRIVASDAHLWADILLANAEAIRAAGDSFNESWATVRQFLAERDRDALTRWLESARQARASLPVRRKGYAQVWAELVVEVQDRPGAIAQVTGILAQHGINLADVEIVRAREGVGGTLRLAMVDPGERDEAVLHLAAAGFHCRTL